MIPNTDVLRDFMEATHEYRFTRTGRDTLTITRLEDGQDISISSNAAFIGFNGRPQAMDIQSFVARRRTSLARPNAQGIPLFGSNGREVWYGGRQDYSDTALDKVWAAIGSKLGRQDSEFPHWPAGRRDLQSHLFIPVNDFDDTEAEALVAPVIDDSDPPVRIAKRRNAVDWRGLDLGTTRIEDKRATVDVRDIPPLTRATIVRAKR